MTREDLLEALKDCTEELLKDFLLPLRPQTNEEQDWPEERAPRVYLMHVPDERSSTKYAPYVLHSIITSQDQQREGYFPESSAQVRTVMCVYGEDDQQGGMALLGLTEKFRYAWNRDPIVGTHYELDKAKGTQFLFYPNQTSPYYMAEMLTTWKLPPIQREVKLW